MRDLHNNQKAQTSIYAKALGTTGTGSVGKVIDRKGFDSVEFVLNYGAVTATNATVTPIVKHGDVTGTLTSVADADLLGTESAAGIAAAATRTSGVSKIVTKRIGYTGNKRYVNVTLVNTISAGIIASASAILGHPALKPVAT